MAPDHTDYMLRDDIKPAAKAYNADYPEAAAEIDAGELTLTVSVTNADRYGRRYNFVATYGVTAPDGGFIAAEEPTVYTVAPRSRSEKMTESARRRFYPQAIAHGCTLRLINNIR